MMPLLATAIVASAGVYAVVTIYYGTLWWMRRVFERCVWRVRMRAGRR